MTFVGSFLLISSLTGSATAEIIRYGFALRELVGIPSIMANNSWGLEETNTVAPDCENPPCMSFNLPPNIITSVTPVNENHYLSNMLVRKEQSGDYTPYPGTYKIAGNGYFMSCSFLGGLNNVTSLWNYENESGYPSIFDSVLMVLFGINCLIGIIGSKPRKRKRRKTHNRRKRKVC